MPHKTYNTPKRKCVVKTRLTEDERRAFEDKCAALSMSQSEYIRQAVFYSRISPVIRVTAHSEEMLTAIIFPCGAVRENRQQPEPDRPVSQRIRRTLQRPVQ